LTVIWPIMYLVGR